MGVNVTTVSKSDIQRVDLLMILVTLGTQDKSFIRLLEAIQKAIELGYIHDEVVVQAGLTNFKSSDMRIFDFISPEEFDSLMRKADLIITHGGVGTIIAALKDNKVVIAAPRLKEFAEHTNNHQIEIIKKLNASGCILPLWDMNDLPNVLLAAKSFKPQPLISNTNNIIDLIRDYLNDLT